MRSSRFILAAVLFLASAQISAKAHELIMFRQAGCEWCADWDRDVGTKYPLTDAGKMAPLRMINIHQKRPDDLAGLKPVVFTPTFVVLKDGREVGRITGYPGEDFFWGLLEKILSDSSTEMSGSQIEARPVSASR